MPPDETGTRGTPSSVDADLASRLAADPALRRERDGLVRLLAAESRAAEPRLDAAAASRVAARVLDRVRAEEERAERGARSAPARPALVRWAWGLGLALAAHVALFAVLGLRAERLGGPEGTEPYRTVQDLARAEPVPDEATPPEARPPAAALPPYLLDDDLLAVERARVLDPARDVVVPLPSTSTDFAPRAVRAMTVRSSDSMKRLIERRVGTAGSLDRVQSSLRALAARQSPDGSWAAPSGATPASSTALVLLAFLGDGHSSRGGEHRAVVERGVAFLRAQGAKDGSAYGLWALAEDYLLVNGALTPAESRLRSGEIAERAAVVASQGDAAGPAEARRLALDAAALVGVGRRRIDGATVPAPSIPAGMSTKPGDARGEAWVGAAILRAGRGDDFRDWAAPASIRLRAQLADDGLAKPRADGSEADRIADTALLLLALQTPYRTL